MPPHARPVRRDVGLDGRRIALLDWGGQGPLVLLHHANGFCKGVFGLVAGPLSHRCRVLAMDGRGHGDSDPAPPDEGYAWAGFADDVGRVAARVCEEIGTDRVALGIGHSFGGTAMLSASADAPERFERLLLVDPVVPPTGAGRDTPERRAHIDQMVGRAEKRRAEWPSLAEARTWLVERELFQGWDARALELYLADGLRALPDGSVVLKCAPAVEAEVFGRGDESDVPALALRVTVPVTFLWAARGNFPREGYEALVRGMPKARVETIDAGHLVPMERPELVVEAALRVLVE